jgi:hypothetical protein
MSRIRERWLCTSYKMMIWVDFEIRDRDRDNDVRRRSKVCVSWGADSGRVDDGTAK